MKAIAMSVLTMMLLPLAGCGINHEWVQDQKMYLAWTEPKIKWLRPSPLIQPRKCKKIEDIPYDPPLEPNWFEKLFNIEMPKTFKGCGLSEYETSHEIAWEPIDMQWDKSIIEKAGPLIHGAMMFGGLGLAGALGGTTVTNNNTTSGVQLRASSIGGDVERFLPR